MSQRRRARRARATILAGAGRPAEHVLIEQLIERLRGALNWQSVFADAEREVWLDAAARYFRLQRKAGFDLECSFELVLAMLTHAHTYMSALDEKRAAPMSRFGLQHEDDWQ